MGLAFVMVSGYDRLKSAENVPPATPAPVAPAATSATLPQPVPLKPAEPRPLADKPANSSRPAEAGGDAAESKPEADRPLTTYQYVMKKDGVGNIVGLGFINGREVKFLADTGATTVVIPEKIARQIGLNKGVPVPFKTGGGVVVHYATNLDTLRLGQIEMRNVAAAINPAMQDDLVLLGMSALGLMDMRIEQGNLVLKYQSAAPAAAEPVIDEPFKRTVKDCAKNGNRFDKDTLNCLRGR